MNQHKAGGSGDDKEMYLDGWNNKAAEHNTKTGGNRLGGYGGFNLIGGTQTDTLVSNSDMSSGDGFITRFFVSEVKKVGPPKDVDVDLDGFNILIGQMLDRREKVDPERSMDDRPVVRVDEGAYQCMQALGVEVYRITQPASGESAGMKTTFSKATSMVGRLALLLHEVSVYQGHSERGALSELCKATARDMFMEYYAQNARAVLQLRGERSKVDALTLSISRHILSTGKERITWGRIRADACGRGEVDDDTLNDAVRILALAGWLRLDARGADVNPGVHTIFAAEAKQFRAESEETRAKIAQSGEERKAASPDDL